MEKYEGAEIIQVRHKKEVSEELYTVVTSSLSKESPDLISFLKV